MKTTRWNIGQYTISEKTRELISYVRRGGIRLMMNWRKTCLELLFFRWSGGGKAFPLLQPHGKITHARYRTSPCEEEAEEYAIHDYEGFGAYQVSEYEGLESVHEVACFLEEHGEVAGDVLAHFGDDLEDARKALEENYSGCYSSLADYAEALTEGTTEIPDHLAFYIDYERMGRDMEMSGDIFTVETGYQEVHVFWAH